MTAAWQKFRGLTEEKWPERKEILRQITRASEHTGALVFVACAILLRAFEVHFEYAVGAFLLLNADRLLRWQPFKIELPRPQLPTVRDIAKSGSIKELMEKAAERASNG